jgi:DNA-binding MarR family transcriptional regulator
MATEPHDARAFARLITEAQRTFANAEREVLAPFGLTPPVFGLLDVIARRDGLSPADAADALAVTRPTVTGWLKQLRELGLVSREAVEDRRRARLTITADGRLVHESGTDQVRRRYVRLLARAIDPSEQADLMDALSRIAAAGRSAADAS